MYLTMNMIILSIHLHTESAYVTPSLNLVKSSEHSIWKSDDTFAHILYVMCHAPVTYRKHTVCMAFYGGRVVTNVQKVF